MLSSVFFRLFPPPRFMMMKHAGLEISDDAVRCLEYHFSHSGTTIQKNAMKDLPPGMVLGGDIKDEKAFSAFLQTFDKEHNLGYAKVSVPEEKAYLFQTDVSPGTVTSIAQNIEFKLEENVPLSAADAIFYFDILPTSVTAGATRASVTVVPRSYIEHMLEVLRGAGIFPLAFEVVPKAIARSIVPASWPDAIMVIHMMNKKTGIYIVCGGVVCFTSTIQWGVKSDNAATDIAPLTKEINRIYTYWTSHGSSPMKIDRILLVGQGAPQYESMIRGVAADANLNVTVANVWTNAFSLDKYLPPIRKEESLDYAVAAGLAMDL